MKRSLSDVDALRVHADALLEQDDPRGEAVQLACELETMSLADPRRRKAERRLDELVADHGESWLRPVRAQLPDVIDVELFRGLPRHLGGKVPDLARAMPELAPIASLKPELLLNEDVARLVALPGFDQLVRLQLPYTYDISASELATLRAGLPALEQLELVLFHPDQLGAFAQATQLRSLKRLELECRGGEIDDLWPLLERAALVHLELRHVRVGKPGLVRLAKVAGSLRTLVLSHAQLDAAAADVLANEPAFAQVESLGVGGNPLKDKGIAALARSKHLANVVRVSFRRWGGDPPFGAAGLEAFVDALAWKKLRALDLAGCTLRAAGVKHLDGLKLDELDLQNNALGDDGVAALAKLKIAPRVLHLDHNTITRYGMPKLAKAAWLPGVEELSLSRNKFASAGGQALGKAKLTKLRVLRLGHNWMGNPGIRAIIAAAPALTDIESGENNFNHVEFLAAIVGAKEPPPLRRIRAFEPPSKLLDQAIASPNLGGVRSLDLVSALLDDDRAMKLAANASLRRIDQLSVIAPKLTASGRDALVAAFGDRVAFGR